MNYILYNIGSIVNLEPRQEANEDKNEFKYKALYI